MLWKLTQALYAEQVVQGEQEEIFGYNLLILWNTSYKIYHIRKALASLCLYKLEDVVEESIHCKSFLFMIFFQ